MIDKCVVVVVWSARANTGETLWIKPEGVEVLTLKQREENDAMKQS
jgi:hypothetical protein